MSEKVIIVGGVFDDRNKLIATPTGAVRDSNFFSNVKAVKALVKTEVTKINRETKTIKAVDLEYDKLILTTGANPIFPDFPGKELENITTLQSMEDADFLKQFAVEKNISKAVVIGGGLIGIETCEALQLAGIDITIVDMLDQVLPFLDWELAKLVENHLVSKGVKVMTGTAVTGFTGENGKVSGLIAWPFGLKK